MNTTAVAFHGVSPSKIIAVEPAVDVQPVYDEKLLALDKEITILKYANQKRQTEIQKIEMDVKECKQDTKELTALDAAQVVYNTEVLDIIAILDRRVTFLFLCLVGINIFNWVILFTYFKLK